MTGSIPSTWDWCEPVGHRQRAGLLRFQGNLLREHDVARNEKTFGHKTQANFGASGVIELMHIGRGTVVDTVSLSAVATDDVKISFGIELRALLGR